MDFVHLCCCQSSGFNRICLHRCACLNCPNPLSLSTLAGLFLASLSESLWGSWLISNFMWKKKDQLDFWLNPRMLTLLSTSNSKHRTFNCPTTPTPTRLVSPEWEGTHDHTRLLSDEIQLCIYISQWAPATPLRRCSASWESCLPPPPRRSRTCPPPPQARRIPTPWRFRERWRGFRWWTSTSCSKLWPTPGRCTPQRLGKPGRSLVWTAAQQCAPLCSVSSSSRPGRLGWSSRQQQSCQFSHTGSPVSSCPAPNPFPDNTGWTSPCMFPPRQVDCYNPSRWISVQQKSSERCPSRSS